MVEKNLISPYYKRSFPITGKKFEGSHGKSQHPGTREKPADLPGSKGENMNKNKKIIAAVVAVIAVIVVFLGVYKVFGPKAQTGEKAYTVEVTAADGSTKTYEGRTDAEYLSGLMDELQEAGDFSYEGTSSDYGLFITAINGETADYDKDGAYWAIYVNGEYGQYGADQQPVADGDSFRFAYESSQQ